MKKMFLGALMLLIAGMVFFVASNSRAATETAPFQVLKADGAFELRSYETLHLAQTPMDPGSPDGKARNSGFMRLFRYITGANEREEKISMTTPVLMSSVGADGRQLMSFVLPKATVEATPPKPAAGVTLANLPSMKVVVIRFSGRSSAELEASKLQQLSQWATSRKLNVETTPLRAYYDPPWTPGFLRRNELMLRVIE